MHGVQHRLSLAAPLERRLGTVIATLFANMVETSPHSQGPEAQPQLDFGEGDLSTIYGEVQSAGIQGTNPLYYYDSLTCEIEGADVIKGLPMFRKFIGRDEENETERKNTRGEDGEEEEEEEGPGKGKSKERNGEDERNEKDMLILRIVSMTLNQPNIASLSYPSDLSLSNQAHDIHLTDEEAFTLVIAPCEAVPLPSATAYLVSIGDSLPKTLLDIDLSSTTLTSPTIGSGGKSQSNSQQVGEGGKGLVSTTTHDGLAMYSKEELEASRIKTERKRTERRLMRMNERLKQLRTLEMKLRKEFEDDDSDDDTDGDEGDDNVNIYDDKHENGGMPRENGKTSEVVYDMNDDEEDLVRLPEPTYLRQAINYLNHRDDDASTSAGLTTGPDGETKGATSRQYVAAALRVIQGLILHAPKTSDRRELVVKTCSSLLHVQVSGTPLGTSSVDGDDESLDYRKLRDRGVVACIVAEPQAVMKYLVTQLYGNNRSIKDRLEILDMIAHAVAQLAEVGVQTGGEGEVTKSIGYDTSSENWGVGPDRMSTSLYARLGLGSEDVKDRLQLELVRAKAALVKGVEDMSRQQLQQQQSPQQVSLREGKMITSGNDSSDNNINTSGSSSSSSSNGGNPVGSWTKSLTTALSANERMLLREWKTQLTARRKALYTVTAGGSTTASSLQAKAKRSRAIHGVTFGSVCADWFFYPLLVPFDVTYVSTQGNPLSGTPSTSSASTIQGVSTTRTWGGGDAGGMGMAGGLDHVSLMSRDPMLIARVIHTLSLMLDCAGPFERTTPHMALSLIHVISLLCMHDHVMARRAALVAFLVILNVLPQHYFIDQSSSSESQSQGGLQVTISGGDSPLNGEEVETRELSRGVVGMIKWVKDVSLGHAEQDEQCKMLAIRCLALAQQKLSEGLDS